MEQCVPPFETGWTVVEYINSVENRSISADAANILLRRRTFKRTAEPQLVTASNRPETGIGTRKKQKPKFELPAGMPDRALEERVWIENAAAVGSQGNLVFLLGLGILLAGVLVHKINTENRHSRLIYELDAAEEQRYSFVRQALVQLAQCDAVWRIESRSLNADWKCNEGASSRVRRTKVDVRGAKPPRVDINVPVKGITVGDLQLFFLPDVILCLARGRYDAISYRDFQVEQSETRFTEEEGVPVDAAVVGQTWRFVNKIGGPDRRFNNNVQLPITQYGVLLLSSPTGLNIHLHTSSAQQSGEFTECWNEFRTGVSRIRARYESRPEPPLDEMDVWSTRKTQALTALGLDDESSDEEMNEAFRRLAQMYHPDKVAGLAPEFQALADTKMKEINAAYTFLKAGAEKGPWQTVQGLRRLPAMMQDLRFLRRVATDGCARVPNAV
jgi:hypothetical protein